VTVTAPPRPPRRPSDPVTHGEFDALVEALIEEARQRGQRRRRRNAAVVTLVTLVGVALFALLGRSAQSQTASPALSARINAPAQAGTSRIAFISEPGAGGYCGSVQVMNPDGSGRHRLTPGPLYDCVQEIQPAWSPDGRKLAIVANIGGKNGIYVMNADGRELKRLTSDAGWVEFPAWSPDGRSLAFLHFDGPPSGEISVMKADGSGRRTLTQGSRAGKPAWSPDGQRIAFMSWRDGNLEIYAINADGAGQRRLTHNAVRDSYPVWSPDGRRIAFERNWQLYVMNADGSGQRPLTRRGAHNFNPAWSPDGKRIAFERGRRQRDYVSCSYCAGLRGLAVFVMNADGSGQRKLTQGGSQPDWSPDGRKIAFVSERDGNKDIWVMNADGSRQRNLIRAAGHRESQPVWSPLQK
jgi:TolB protein